MKSFKQIWHGLFHRGEPNDGRYKVVVDETHLSLDRHFTTSVMVDEEDEIVPKVEREMKHSYAEKIKITGVFYQASKGGTFEKAALMDETIQEIYTFFEQVLPKERVRNYVLTLLASFLNGSTGNEKFQERGRNSLRRSWRRVRWQSCGGRNIWRIQSRWSVDDDVVSADVC